MRKIRAQPSDPENLSALANYAPADLKGKSIPDIHMLRMRWNIGRAIQTISWQ